MDRQELEDVVWELPSIQQSGIDFDVIESMTDAELHELLNPTKPAPVAIEKPAKPARVAKTQLPAPRCTGFEYIERGSRLIRRETWEHWNDAGSWTTVENVTCGNRVQWNGRTVSASIVLHWLRTGETVKRVPRVAAKRFRGVVRVGETVKHVGYFSTAEERDRAVMMAKLGIYPNGAK